MDTAYRPGRVARMMTLANFAANLAARNWWVLSLSVVYRHCEAYHVSGIPNEPLRPQPVRQYRFLRFFDPEF